jgi:hypothetical protein
LTDLTDYLRLVLRTSRSTADAPPADAPAARQLDRPPVQTSLGTPVAVPQSWPVRAARRAKPVSAIQPGDAIRLETGERVVVTYVCTDRAPGHRYIEWRGPLPSNWAKLPLDALIVLC